MRILLTAATISVIASPAWAVSPQVPEMSAGPAIAAIALLAGIGAIIRETIKRK
ncbi:MAG: hypothetical protein DHS20C05_14470 [Hyphococcus sp.]|nr:MAG: hypothetical protein DHS20C05_14470 [Marinicaulis sp.]